MPVTQASYTYIGRRNLVITREDGEDFGRDLCFGWWCSLRCNTSFKFQCGTLVLAQTHTCQRCHPHDDTSQVVCSTLVPFQQLVSLHHCSTECVWAYFFQSLFYLDISTDRTAHPPLCIKRLYCNCNHRCPAQPIETQSASWQQTAYNHGKLQDHQDEKRGRQRKKQKRNMGTVGKGDAVWF